ncbi:Uncharacterised protein [uncultured archaeon]|nr:Uncharacterised protein [uncultured archaeon]
MTSTQKILDLLDKVENNQLIIKEYIESTHDDIELEKKLAELRTELRELQLAVVNSKSTIDSLNKNISNLTSKQEELNNSMKEKLILKSVNEAKIDERIKLKTVELEALEQKTTKMISDLDKAIKEKQVRLEFLNQETHINQEALETIKSEIKGLSKSIATKDEPFIWKEINREVNTNMKNKTISGLIKVDINLNINLDIFLQMLINFIKKNEHINDNDWIRMFMSNERFKFATDVMPYVGLTSGLLFNKIQEQITYTKFYIMNDTIIKLTICETNIKSEIIANPNNVSVETELMLRDSMRYAIDNEGKIYATVRRLSQIKIYNPEVRMISSYTSGWNNLIPTFNADIYDVSIDNSYFKNHIMMLSNKDKTEGYVGLLNEIIQLTDCCCNLNIRESYQSAEERYNRYLAPKIKFIGLIDKHNVFINRHCHTDTQIGLGVFTYFKQFLQKFQTDEKDCWIHPKNEQFNLQNFKIYMIYLAC